MDNKLLGPRIASGRPSRDLHGDPRRIDRAIRHELGLRNPVPILIVGDPECHHNKRVRDIAGRPPLDLPVLVADEDLLLLAVGEPISVQVELNTTAFALSAAADTNHRMTVASVGALRGGSVEVTVRIVESHTLVPQLPPALITLLGPAPDYTGGGDRTRFDGEDCAGAGEPGLYMPVIGTIGTPAEGDAEAGMCAGKKCETIDYVSGPYDELDTIADLTDPINEPLVAAPIDPVWTNCVKLKEMIEGIRQRATFVCSGGGCSLPATTSSSITFYDGDLTLQETETGQGLLVVTGKFDTLGYNAWRGMILVVGEGWAEPGNEDNSYSGGMVVADIAGPDEMYGTSDDCTGGDGGFDSIHTDTVYEDNLWEYCTNDMLDANPRLPYTLTSFRQQ